MSGTMMACGCAAQGVRNMPDGSKPPVCITHSCVEVAASPPDFSGRMAKCSYSDCKAPPRPSDPAKLAFFVYRGPGSPEAEESCVCGYHKIAHSPRYRCSTKLVRRWYKIERTEEVMTTEAHHHTEENAKAWAEAVAESWRSRNRDKNTEVFSAENMGVVRINSPLRCRAFKAKGPQQFDHYYCGCKGWD